MENFKEYAAEAIKTLRSTTTDDCLAMGLIEKVGEVAKCHRLAIKSGRCDTALLVIRLGEVLWYLAAIAHRDDCIDIDGHLWPTQQRPKGFDYRFVFVHDLSVSCSEIATANDPTESLQRSLASCWAIATGHNLGIEEIAAANIEALRRKS